MRIEVLLALRAPGEALKDTEPRAVQGTVKMLREKDVVGKGFGKTKKAKHGKLQGCHGTMGTPQC